MRFWNGLMPVRQIRGAAAQANGVRGRCRPALQNVPPKTAVTVQLTSAALKDLLDAAALAFGLVGRRRKAK